jgi:Predicted carbamoyl transferase, NodU family
MPRILVGLGGLLSDAACCVVKNGRLVSAVEQSKVSHWGRHSQFPDEAFSAALEAAEVEPAEIECVAIARPFAQGSESGAQLELRSRFPRSEIVVVEHHTAHAASAYYASNFDSATVLSVDRAGDFRSAVLFEGSGNRLTPVRELYFPDSLGDLFNRVTALLGYQPRSDEHKVQWLSTSGEPTEHQLFADLLHRNGVAWPQIDRSYLDADRLTQGGFSRRFYDAIELSPNERIPAAKQASIAASLQQAINETVAGVLGGAQHVCIAGGLALNALLIASLERQFPNVFVQPAAGNAGTALGAALHTWHHFYRQAERVPFDTLCLGPQYSAEQIKRVLENCKLHFRFLLTEGEVIDQAIRALNANKIVAWMQGRMEFGPRALGNRSILASPRNPYSTENLNVYIKHRESFRKFAASVPAEAASDYFDVGSNARFLATVGRVRPEHKKQFEAALLGGDIIRVHTVERNENPRYHALLTAAGKATGLPVLYNTSFNLFGDPLVCTPRDAVRSFYSSGIDAMFAGNFHLEK